jgi:hypothetical protein
VIGTDAVICGRRRIGQWGGRRVERRRGEVRPHAASSAASASLTVSSMLSGGGV